MLKIFVFESDLEKDINCEYCTKSLQSILKWLFYCCRFFAFGEYECGFIRYQHSCKVEEEQERREPENEYKRRYVYVCRCRIEVHLFVEVTISTNCATEL